MSIGSPFDSRTQPLNVRRQWRQWSATYAASAYAPHIDIEVNAIRNAAALIDISPLFKYHLEGPDAERLVDRVITRSAARGDARARHLHALVRRRRPHASTTVPSIGSTTARGAGPRPRASSAGCASMRAAWT